MEACTSDSCMMKYKQMSLARCKCYRGGGRVAHQLRMLAYATIVSQYGNPLDRSSEKRSDDGAATTGLACIVLLDLRMDRR